MELSLDGYQIVDIRGNVNAMARYPRREPDGALPVTRHDSASGTRERARGAGPGAVRDATMTTKGRDGFGVVRNPVIFCGRGERSFLLCPWYH